MCNWSPWTKEEKNICEVMAKVLPIDHDCKTIDLRNPGKPKHRKYEENHTKVYHNQITQNQRWKEKIFKYLEKQMHVFTDEQKLRITRDLSLETLQMRRQWNIFNVLKEKKNSTMNSIPSKNIF